MQDFNSFLQLEHADSEGTIRLLLQTLWDTDQDVFGSILGEFERKITAYETALNTSIEANHLSGDKQTAAAILSVAVTASDKSRSEQAKVFGVNDSQIATAVR